MIYSIFCGGRRRGLFLKSESRLCVSAVPDGTGAGAASVFAPKKSCEFFVLPFNRIVKFIIILRSIRNSAGAFSALR